MTHRFASTHYLFAPPYYGEAEESPRPAILEQNRRALQQRAVAWRQYARLGSMKQAPERACSRQVLAHAMEQLAAQIDGREAIINIGALPELMVDSGQLSLLFYCLLSNALNFSKDIPDIAITARRAHSAWLFSVCDNGIGIAPEHHEAVFRPFWRLGASSGCGMGLAMARRISSLHGGHLWLDSTYNAGSAFHFTLPAD